jgi:hypothetical protein
VPGFALRCSSRVAWIKTILAVGGTDSCLSIADRGLHPSDTSPFSKRRADTMDLLYLIRGEHQALKCKLDKSPGCAYHNVSGEYEKLPVRTESGTDQAWS